MPVTIAGQWAAASSPVLGQSPLPPAAASLPVTASNIAGDWLFALCAWQQGAPGQGATVSVGDDAHNRWEPLGAPAADSAAAGAVRVSLWYAPAARVGNTALGTTTVMMAPTALCNALALIVLDVAGLSPWDKISFVPVTGFAAAAASLALTSGVPVGGASSFAVTACASDLLTATLSLTSGAGWTALTSASAGAAGSAGQIRLNAQWKQITAANSVTWTAAVAADLAAIIGAVVVQPAAPVAPNPNWPIVITEIAPGAGPGTPPSQLSWVSASARDLSFTVTQGQPYLLGGLQAAQGALVLDNPDLALTPPGSGAFAGIDSGTPVRVRALWPPSATPHYTRFSGHLQQAPTSFDEQLRGVIAGTVTDAFAYATGYLPPCLQAELLSDPSLYALWPCNDPAGSGGASNRAPGNQKPLLVSLSKYGTGATTQGFGLNTGALKGDSGSGLWAESGVAAAGTQGSSLVCADAGYPPITNGVTVEGWFQMTSTTPSSGDVLTLVNAVQNVLLAQISGTTLTVSGFYNNTTLTAIPLSTLNFSTAPLWHLAVAFSRTTYAIYVNGALVASGAWARALPAAFSQLWCNGNLAPAAGGFFGKLYNGYTAYVALFAAMLPAARVAAHYTAGATAFAGEYAHMRIERILGYAGVTGRRVIVPEAPGLPVPGAAPLTMPPQDVTPMASMATLGGTIPSLFTPGTPGFTPSSGTQANGALTATAASLAPALLTAAPEGGLFFYPRSYAANGPARWALGDGPGEIPYLPGATFPYDPGTVRNNIQLTQPDTGTVTVPAVAEAASVAQYGGQSYQVTAHLQDDATAGYTWSPTMADLASWIAEANYTPHLRAAVTVRASHLLPAVAAAAWPFVLGAAPGDMVTVSARPPTSGATISVTARIVQVTATLTISPSGTDGSAQVVLDSAPEQNILLCDDPVRGVLNGANVLGW